MSKLPNFTPSWNPDKNPSPRNRTYASASPKGFTVKQSYLVETTEESLLKQIASLKEEIDLLKSVIRELDEEYFSDES